MTVRAGARRGACDSVWTLLDDRVLRAAAPLPGVEGTGGSLWPLVARGTGDALVVAPVAVGATTMAEWAPGGAGWPLVERRFRAASAAGLPIRAVVVMVGEADAAQGTSAAAWRAAFDAFVAGLRGVGLTAPVVVARESRCFERPPSATIGRVQRDVVDGIAVLAGPDLDALDHGMRWDGCHLTRAGMRVVASELRRTLGIAPP